MKQLVYIFILLGMAISSLTAMESSGNQNVLRILSKEKEKVWLDWVDDQERFVQSVGPDGIEFCDSETGGFLLVIKGLFAWAAMSPCGKFVALADHKPNARKMFLVRVLNAQSHDLVKKFGHAARVNHLSWSPDSETIVTASDEGLVRTWRLHTKGMGGVKCGEKIAQAHWSPKRNLIAVLSNGATYDDPQEVIILQRSGLQKLVSLEVARRVLRLVWDNEGDKLAVVYADGHPTSYYGIEGAN